MIGRLLAGLICAGALLISPLPLRAEERINDYQVDIEVAEDGLLEITERILITSKSYQIVHGINREIPLAFIAADGHRARSFLTVLDVERDGELENHEIIENNRGAVIRIGRSDVKLVPDEYLYTIRYQVNRVVSHSDEHDRLIWNVNGNEGYFPIDALSVRVVLPDGTAPLATDVHTGHFGEEGKDALIKKSGNVVSFKATRPYAAGENMTIALLLPKGAIQPPDEATLSQWKDYDYASTISGAVTFTWSALLAFLLWFLFGRDPRRGVIVPRWDPPDGMSPGRVGYSVSRNFETGFWTAFSATIIDLAVKGKVVLEDLSDGITVRKTSDEEDSRLPTGQAAIMKMLPPAGERFRFNSESATQTRELGDAFCNAVIAENGHKYYTPRKWIWISFALLMFLALIVHESSFTVGVEYLDGWLPEHWIPAIAAWFFATKAVRKWRELLFLSRPAGARKGSILLNLFITVAILLVFALIVYADAPMPRDNFLLTFSLAMIATLLWAFIGRLSRKGRGVMDGIDGLRLYLELAEKERMALADAPIMSPAHYETLLPYAVALGVEKAWSNHFETALAEAKKTDDQGGYLPTWYTGSNAGTPGRAAEISEFSSGIASRIENSLPSESGSYGSGGSGSSGGGRGGGGVSGW